MLKKMINSKTYFFYFLKYKILNLFYSTNSRKFVHYKYWEIIIK